VSEWQVIWLGTMAVALVIMAIVQVAVLVAAMRVGRELAQTSQELRREIKPLVERAQRISDDAARAAALAAVQAERVDRLFASTAQKVEDTVSVLQGALLEPVRQGATLFAALRAFTAGFRGSASQPHHRREDEEALFVG
jgi:hypothetical protein